MSDPYNCQPFLVGWSSPLSDLTLAFFYDCYILLRTLFDILKIMICVINHTLFILYTLISVLICNSIYYSSWVSVFFIRGILGLEDKSTSAFCWLLAIVFVYFYYEHQHHMLFISLPRGLRFQAQQQNNLLRRLYGMLVFRPSSTRQRVTQYEQSSAMVRENQRNAEAEIEPINRQLEAQNVLNENEENFLVEADHRRVLHDNRHNVALENGADSQRAQIENRRNVERECHNTQTRLENHRNCTQERHRYFLRQRRSMPGLNNSHGQDGLSDSQNRLPLSGSHLVETVDVRQLQGVHRREEDLLLNQF